MIRFLATLFRTLHFVIGVTAPPPGENDRGFVLMWLGICAFGLLWCAFLYYLMQNVF